MSQLTISEMKISFPDRDFYSSADFLPSFSMSRKVGNAKPVYFEDCMISWNEKKNQFEVFQDLDDSDEETMYIPMDSVDSKSINFDEDEEVVTFKYDHLGSTDTISISTMDPPMLRKLMILFCAKKSLKIPIALNDKKFESDAEEDDDDSDFEDDDEESDEDDDESEANESETDDSMEDSQ